MNNDKNKTTESLKRMIHDPKLSALEHKKYLERTMGKNYVKWLEKTKKI